MSAPLPFATLKQAAALLGVTPGRLRYAANLRRYGAASNEALAGRLGILKLGRDWYVSTDALEAEIQRRGRP